MPHCMNFSNKACFHGDHLSPYCTTFYGSRAHNASAVTYLIFTSLSFWWIWMNWIFSSVCIDHDHYINDILILYDNKNILVSAEERAERELSTDIQICCCFRLPFPCDSSSQYCHFSIFFFLEGVTSSLGQVLALLTVLRRMSCKNINTFFKSRPSI